MDNRCPIILHGPLSGETYYAGLLLILVRIKTRSSLKVSQESKANPQSPTKLFGAIR